MFDGAKLVGFTSGAYSAIFLLQLMSVFILSVDCLCAVKVFGLIECVLALYCMAETQ